MLKSLPRKNIMMIKVETFLNLVSKIATAVGDDDLIKISFINQGGKQLYTLVSYDGLGLQFQSVSAYEGEAEKEGSYIVKASMLVKTLTLYKELGVESITLVPEENGVVLKDGKGSTTLALLDKMALLSEESINEGIKGMFAAPLKSLQESLKVASISIAKETMKNLNGVYFSLDSEAKQYTVYAADGFIGTRTAITADIKLTDGMTADKMSFFAMPQVVKAVMALKGDAITGIVTEKYLLLRDGENTIAVVALNAANYPLPLMSQAFATEAVEGIDVYGKVELPVSTFIAATELCTLSATDKTKVVKLNYSDSKFVVSELADKSARSIDAAKVTVENPKVLEKTYLVDIVRRALRAVATEKVTVKFTSKFDLLYAEASDVPVAFFLPRK